MNSTPRVSRSVRLKGPRENFFALFRAALRELEAFREELLEGEENGGGSFRQLHRSFLS
jgi:hypothetical protein